MAKDTVPPNAELTDIIDSWRGGLQPDTQAALDAHPELRERSSVIVQLAHEEYCLRRDAGEKVAPSTFVEQFPTVRYELRQMLAVEDLVEDLDQPETWPEVGECFLGFQLESLLGSGAAARVYLARQIKLGNRYVALKVSRFGSSEAETLGKLQHENVVHVLSAHHDEVRGLSAVCMPYYGGATLYHILRRAFSKEGQLPSRADVILQAARDCPLVGEFIRSETPADPILSDGSYIEAVVHLVAELARGLAYTHEHSILHRDLKPSNVLVTPNGHPKLLDFNLSWDADLEVTRLGGTLPYMPPEQITATFFTESPPLSDDPRSDVYSLGVILFELLTGRVPFLPTSENRLEGLHEQLYAQSRGAENVRTLNPEVPKALAKLVARCLAFERLRRPATAALLGERLSSLLPRREAKLADSRPQLRPWIKWSASIVAAMAVTAMMFNLVNLARNQNPASGQPDSSIALQLPDMPATVEGLLEAARTEFEIEQGNMWQAQAYLKKAQGMRPDLVLTPHIAYSYFRLQYPTDATQHLEEALAKDAKNADLNNNLGYCHLLARHYELAKHFLTLALDANPQHPQALFNRAFYNLHLGDRDEELMDDDAGVDHMKNAINVLSQLDQFQSDRSAQRILHYHAAQIMGLAIRTGRTGRGDAAELLPQLQKHLSQAVDLQLASEMLTGQRNFKDFEQEPWFQRLVARASADTSSDDDKSTLNYVPPSWDVGEQSSAVASVLPNK